MLGLGLLVCPCFRFLGVRFCLVTIGVRPCFFNTFGPRLYHNFSFINIPVYGLAIVGLIVMPKWGSFQFALLWDFGRFGILFRVRFRHMRVLFTGVQWVQQITVGRDVLVIVPSCGLCNVCVFGLHFLGTYYALNCCLQ